MEKGADIEAQEDEHGATPLHEAAFYGHKEVVEFFVEKGASVNAKDEHGATPLHEAAYEGHKEIVEFFVEKGASVKAQDKNGRTPLHLAKEALKETTDEEYKKRLSEVIAYLKSKGGQ